MGTHIVSLVFFGVSISFSNVKFFLLKCSFYSISRLFRSTDLYMAYSLRVADAVDYE